MKNYINGNYGKKLTLVPMNDCHIPGNAFARFESYTHNLKGSARLGLQLVPGKEGISLFIVTDSKTALNNDDLNWILNGYATFRNGAPVRAFFTNSKRKIYVLAKGSNYDRDPFEYYSDDYNDDLFAEMQKTGTKIQILAGTDEFSSGCIFLSVPGEMSVKLKAVLNMTFRDLEVRPFTDRCKAEYDLSDIRICRYATSLLGRINNAGSAVPESKNETVYTDDEEDDEEDLPDPEDLFPESFLDGIPESSDYFKDPDDEPEDTPAHKEPEKITQENIPIEELGFTTRTCIVLKRAGINDLKALQNLSAVDLMSMKRLGVFGRDEVRAVLEKYAAPEKEQASDEKPAPSHMQELDDLIGLENVKEQVRKIAAYARMKKAMDEAGNGKLSMALNTEFTGNPGTAKTTVARILAGIFYEIGLLRSSDIVEVGRSDLVAGYVGQTAPKVRDVFNKADGKLLFIDEAYSLANSSSGNDFGDEAIDAIVQEMENRRARTIVIFAGYPDKMKDFFDRNPGLRSRVPFTVSFTDYPVETLVRIAESEASKRGFRITSDALGKISSLCTEASKQTEFGNGRFCRNLVENAILNFASRNFGSDNVTSMPESMDLIADDFSMPTLTKKTKPEKKFGLV